MEVVFVRCIFRSSSGTIAEEQPSAIIIKDCCFVDGVLQGINSSQADAGKASTEPLTGPADTPATESKAA